ncbi:LysR substrate-binding domain-containing protein [Edwardsiella anguillarum]|nr:LysR substrate-binding domain-containing protein [Edwardsiella anguillarum]
MIFSRVVKSLFQQAPNARIEILPIGDDLFSSLKFGRMDLAIYPLIDIPADFHEANLFKTTFSCLVRQGHPLARQMLRGETPTLAQINAYRRLQVSLHDGQPGATVGNAVHRQGKDYDVAMSVPYFLAAPMILAQTDFVLTLPTQTARHFSQMANLAILPYPDGETAFYTRLIWHHRVHHDPVIQWLRALFLRFVSEEAALERDGITPTPREAAPAQSATRRDSLGYPEPRGVPLRWRSPPDRIRVPHRRRRKSAGYWSDGDSRRGLRR